jgi:hypothetical protein
LSATRIAWALGAFSLPIVVVTYARADDPAPATADMASPDASSPDAPSASAAASPPDASPPDAGASWSDEPTPRGAPPPPQRWPLDVDTAPPLSILPSSEDKWVDPRMARSWSALPPRLFAATTVDVGFVYARPRLSLGYGQPFTSWVGLDMNPVVSGTGFGVYGGLRLEVPFLDVRVGPRYFQAFSHTYLPLQSSYDRLALETDTGNPARVVTYEAEMDTSFPVGPGNVLARGSVSYVTGVPEGQAAFEETLRVIVRPPLVWRARGGYALRFGQYSQHSAGLVVDVLDVPLRDDSRTVRVGPVLRLVLSRRVEVRGSFVVTVSSPDRIGLPGGDFTELGVRYRWATE